MFLLPHYFLRCIKTQRSYFSSNTHIILDYGLYSMKLVRIANHKKLWLVCFTQSLVLSWQMRPIRDLLTLPPMWQEVLVRSRVDNFESRHSHSIMYTGLSMCTKWMDLSSPMSFWMLLLQYGPGICSNWSRYYTFSRLGGHIFIVSFLALERAEEMVCFESLVLVLGM